MTDRDKSTLECPEKMCDYCCNFDKEHIGMDGMSLCKLTMTLAYAEDYGGNCMFYNVPKEQIIVPPCKVGDWVWYIRSDKINKAKIEESVYSASKHGYFSDDWCFHSYNFSKKEEFTFWSDNMGKTVFLTKEEAERALKERDN